VLDAGGAPVMLDIAPDTLDDTCEKINSGLNVDIFLWIRRLPDRSPER
jgi:hypothetical protein